MCGLTGYLDFHQQTEPGVLARMTDALSHRGPDARGELEIELPNSQLGLGHRRLSVIDLSAGANQPMVRGQLSIIYNGEIYNYKELQQELRKAGVQFRTAGDTETILAAVEQWGVSKAVSKFNGMFAFALYDQRSRQLHLVRDRAGVKPLYLYADHGLFLFASELKAMHQHPAFKRVLNRSAVDSYFRLGYVPGSQCIFENVLKIPPGQIHTIDVSSGEQQSEKYWEIFDTIGQPCLDIDLVEAKRQLDELLISAFNYRMVSDVPVGIFLSGGYDSSILTAILQNQSAAKLKTFTIGFEESAFDESPYASEIAKHLGTEHVEQTCTMQEAQQIIPSLPEVYDEPFADPSAIPTILVSRLARQHVTVALSADAGDELFGGYNKHALAIEFADFAHRLPRPLRQSWFFRIMAGSRFRPYQRTFAGLHAVYANNATHSDLMMQFSQTFYDRERADLLGGKPRPRPGKATANGTRPSAADPLNAMLGTDYKNYLADDILTKVDRATMSVSLEGREPLLDFRLAEFASRLPPAFKISKAERKIILKSLAHDYLPKSLLDRPKKGFSIPFAGWLRTDLRDMLEELLSEQRIREQGILDCQITSSLKRRFLRNSERTERGIWSLLMFQLWMDRWAAGCPVTSD